MAMGADKAIHVEVDQAAYDKMQPLHVAKILAKVAQENKVDLILMGKQVKLSTPYSFTTYTQ
jgi:electron transfer flavoprotein beta subunit